MSLLALWVGVDAKDHQNPTQGSPRYCHSLGLYEPSPPIKPLPSPSLPHAGRQSMPPSLVRKQRQNRVG